MTSHGLREDYSRQSDEPPASERNLGVTFAVVLAFVGAIKLYRGSDAGLYWLAAAALFLACAFLWTAPLRPLNLVSHRLGLLLFAVVSPIVMGVVSALSNQRRHTIRLYIPAHPGSM
jgi:hypothetical protein